MNDEDEIKFWQQGLKQGYCTIEYAKQCRSNIRRLKRKIRENDI